MAIYQKYAMHPRFVAFKSPCFHQVWFNSMPFKSNQINSIQFICPQSIITITRRRMDITQHCATFSLRPPKKTWLTTECDPLPQKRWYTTIPCIWTNSNLICTILIRCLKSGCLSFRAKPWKSQNWHITAHRLRQHHDANACNCVLARFRLLAIDHLHWKSLLASTS